MIYLVISLVVLGIVAALLSLRQHDGAEATPSAASCGTCDGTNTKCEQECMMEAATREIEYYDDEELDRYRGRRSDEYTDDEVHEFADVLYTMRPDEVAGWNRSLILRGINLPDALKDEVIILMER